MALYLQDSPGLARTGPGLVRLKVAHVRTCPELTSPRETLAILEFKYLPVQAAFSTKITKEFFKDFFVLYGRVVLSDAK